MNGIINIINRELRLVRRSGYEAFGLKGLIKGLLCGDGLLINLSKPQ